MLTGALSSAMGGLQRNAFSVARTAHNIANVNTEGEDVQLPEEMVDLTIGQRGFEVNTVSVQTADEMLRDLMNMKR